MNESTRKLLCSLVDQGFTATIGKSAWISAILRWGEDSFNKDTKKNIDHFPGMSKEDWYMFEIGRNCGTVFSADIVESITIKDRHCIIHLKG